MTRYDANTVEGREMIAVADMVMVEAAALAALEAELTTATRARNTAISEIGKQARKHEVELAEARKEVVAIKAEVDASTENLSRSLFGDEQFESSRDSCIAEFVLDAEGAAQIIRRLRKEVAALTRQRDEALAIINRTAELMEER